MKPLGVKRRLQTLRESCCPKQRNFPGTVAEVESLADELLQQVVQSGIQADNNATIGTVSVV